MIVLHFLEGCQFSEAALELLRRHKVPHDLVVHDRESKAELIRKLHKRLDGHTTMPIVYCQKTGRFIGGYSQLAKVMKNEGPAGLGLLCRK